MSETLISLKNIKKYFGGVRALDGVDLEIKKGEIHCLAGENGCGKSTLINIISGYYTPDEGEIEFGGVKYSRFTPKQAIENGIQVIYQDLSLFPNLTVMENLALNMELANKRKIVNKKRYREIANQAIEKTSFIIDLDEYVDNLSVADKQLIAISRALLSDAKLIIMDEPTSAITKKEVQSLFEVIRELQKQDIAVLFVSHKLDEVFEIAERFTIFRNGRNVAVGNSSELDQEKFTYYMTGRQINEAQFQYTSGKEANTVLEVKKFSLRNRFNDVNFSLKQGEILGITGLLGCGRTELAQAIFGYRKADSGEMFLNGKQVDIQSVKDAIGSGIGYVPPERIKEGLFLDQPISDNVTIVKWKEYSGKLGFVNRKRIDEAVDKWVRELSIMLHNSSDFVRTLSGGNQQKCVLAKWLLLDLKVLILDGPTVGVDIGAKFDIHEIIKRLAQTGLSVIVLSDDLPEVFAVCNRILVMRRGKMVAEKNTRDLQAAELAELV